MHRYLLAAGVVAAGLLAAPHAKATENYFLSSPTIGCQDVQGAIAVRRALPPISNGLTFAQALAIEQNGCERLDANLAGTIIGRPSGPFVQFKPDGGDWAPAWVRRDLLTAY